MTRASLNEALAPLQRMVESEAVWDLPEYVHVKPPAWMVIPQVLLVAVAGLILLAWTQTSNGLGLLLVIAAVATVLAIAHVLSRRRSLPLGEGSLKSDQGRGCMVDVVKRQVLTLGCEPEQQWQLAPAQEWSLGCLAFEDKPRRRYGWRIELRHVRRGPVLMLCTVLYQGHLVKDQQALDDLVNGMAARLSIRRSGIGTRTASKS